MAIVRLLDSCGNWIIINTAVGVTADDIGLGNVQNDLTYLTNRKAKLSTDSPDEKGYRIGNVMLSSDFTINANGEISLNGGGGGSNSDVFEISSSTTSADLKAALNAHKTIIYKDIDTGGSLTTYLIFVATNPVVFRESDVGNFTMYALDSSTTTQTKIYARTIAVNNHSTPINIGSRTLITISNTTPPATDTTFGGFKLVTYTQSFTTTDWTTTSSLSLLNITLASNYSDSNLLYMNSKLTIPGDNLVHYGDDYTLIDGSGTYTAVSTLNIIEDTSAHTLTAQLFAEAGAEFAGTVEVRFLSLV